MLVLRGSVLRQVQWRDVVVGDIIKVLPIFEHFPTDLLTLSADLLSSTQMGQLEC